MKKITFALWFIALNNIINAQIDAALASQLQNVLNTQVSSQGNHGVSAHLILQNGQTWSGTAGVGALGTQMTDSTVFIGASSSKMSIAIVLLSMQEDNIISLNDSWHKYLPTLNVAFDTSITIRQLLSHTSGIKDYLEVSTNNHYVTSNFSNFYTPQYVLENIVSGVPDFPRGTNFNYSNSNYLLAATIAEAATPNPLALELRNRVWTPAGMKHTYYGAYEPILDPRAGVWWDFGSGVTDYSNQSDTCMLSYGYGTDNVVTCPTDLANLVHALLNNQLLNSQSMSEMLTFVPQSASNWTGLYGLGLHHLLGQAVDTVLGHDGKFCNLSDVFHSNMCGFTLATMTNTKTLWEGIYNPMYNVIRNYYQCNTSPVANFHANYRIACPGTIITFNDSSANWKPSSWRWNFPGGTLTGGSTVTDSMPKVTYTSSGTYAVSYTATTSGGSSSITKNSFITVNSNVPAYNTSFLESFETTTLPSSDWAVSNNVGLNWAVTSLCAATGNKSIYIDNFWNTPGNSSQLVSTSFDISGLSSPTLSFKMAYQQKALTNADKLQVLTSTNCGNSWTPRWTKSGSLLATLTPPSNLPFVPNSTQFNTYTISLSGLAGSTNLRFKFNFFADVAAPGNNIFIDDINIFDALALGVKVIESQIELNFYPNPTSSQVNIISSITIDEINIKDVLGRYIYEAKPNDKSTSLTINQEGIYFVTMKLGQHTVTKKLIVSH